MLHLSCVYVTKLVSKDNQAAVTAEHCSCDLLWRLSAKLRQCFRSVAV